MSGLLIGAVLFAIGVTGYWLGYRHRELFDPVLKIPGRGETLALIFVFALALGTVFIAAAIIGWLD